MSGLLGPSDGERGVMNGESSSLARIEKRCRPRLVTELEPCVSCEEGNIWDCVAVSPKESIRFEPAGHSDCVPLTFAALPIRFLLA